MKLYKVFAVVIAVGLIASLCASPTWAKVNFQQFINSVPSAQGHWSNASWDSEQSRIQRTQRASYREPADASWIQRSIRRTQHVEMAQAPTVSGTIQVEEVPAPQGRPRISQPENVGGETVYIQDADGYYRQDEYPGETISGPGDYCDDCNQTSDCQDCGSYEQCGGCNECGQAGQPHDFWDGYEVGARMGGPFPHLAGTTWVLFSKYLSFHFGVQSFKGPSDFGEMGNYGFNGGLNLGVPFGYRGRLGLQAGLSFVTSDFSGYSYPQDSSNTRNQVFFTAGIFNRAQCGKGWQWGLALDIMNDSYYDESTLTQIRPEIGYIFDCGIREIGFFGAYGLDNQEVIITQQLRGVYESVDLNAFYFRKHFTYGGEGRVWGGFTGWGDGLFGADMRVPVGESWAFEGGFNYMIPRGDKGGSALDRESWGLVLNLVWTPTRCARQESKSRHRPLFGVANNNTFMRNLKFN